MKGKTKKQVRGEVDSEVKRRFDAAYRFKGVKYNEALEQAMELFTKTNIMKPDISKLMEGT